MKTEIIFDLILLALAAALVVMNYLNLRAIKREAKRRRASSWAEIVPTRPDSSQLVPPALDSHPQSPTTEPT